MVSRGVHTRHKIRYLRLEWNEMIKWFSRGNGQCFFFLSWSYPAEISHSIERRFDVKMWSFALSVAIVVSNEI